MVALARSDVAFVVAGPYLGTFADGAQHLIGALHHSTIVHVDHFGDHWLAKLADGQQVNFECAGSPITPMGYDCMDVLTWRLLDGKPQVVNLIGNTFVSGDIDYGDQKLYHEDAVSTDPKARRSYGGRSNMGTFHAKPQVQPRPITFTANRVMPLWSKAFGCAVGYKFYPADPKDEMASFKVETMPDPRFGLRGFISELDRIVGLWQVTYRKVNGHCELIDIKECDMGELNETIGHWLAVPEAAKKARGECRKLIIKNKLHLLYYPDTHLKDIEQLVIQDQWIPAMLKVAQGQPLTTSPFDSWTTAEPHAKEWAEKMKAGAPKPADAKKDVPDHEHVFETAHCNVCGIHWSKVEKIRAGLHVWIDELFANRNADEKTHDAQYEFVKEANGVKHLEECDLNLEAFKAEAKGMVEAMYPLENAPGNLTKDLMGKWLAEFKTIRPDVSDKNEAIKLVAGLFSDDVNAGLHTVTALVANVGVDGAQKQWDELKHMLKPAAPKNGNHPPEDKPAQQPSNEQKPRPQQPPAKPPVQRQNFFEDGDPFVDATEDTPYLRMALVGPAGSGKTYTALKIATAMFPEGKIALLDSERGSAAKYRNDFKFKVLKLEDYDPNYYISAIHAAERNSYDVLIIDSLSHAWEGKGGMLEMHDNEVKRMRNPNSFTAWREVTPLHNDLVDAMLNAKCHIIVTLRAKTEYVQQNGKVEKVGLAPIQRPGLEYEFDIVADLDLANNFVVSKSRCSALNRAVFAQAGKEVADKLNGWLKVA